MILICIILFICSIILILIYTKFELFSKKNQLVSDNNHKIISDSDKNNFPFSN